MAVESRFVVIRQGVEVETFMDKKAADEYDKMLDMADNLAELFENATLELSESMREELSVYIAQNREEVLIALQAKKPKAAKKPASKAAVQSDVNNDKDKKSAAA
ncbi:MAG: YebG family protein [Thalassotalea sp.]|nr:YebG family protein [Thalassotalea sp.]